MKSPEARNSLGSSDSALGRCYFHSPKDLTKEGKSPVKMMCVGSGILSGDRDMVRGLTGTEDPGWIQGLGGRSQETRLKGWKEARVCRVGPGLRGGCDTLSWEAAQHARCRHTQTLNKAHELIVIQHLVHAKGRDQQGWDPRGAEVCQPPSWEQHPACSLHTPRVSSSLPGAPALVLPAAPPPWHWVFAPVPPHAWCAPCCRLPHNLRSLLRRSLLQGLPLPP